MKLWKKLSVHRERTAEHTDSLQQRMAVLMGVLQEQQKKLFRSFGHDVYVFSLGKKQRKHGVGIALLGKPGYEAQREELLKRL